MAPDSLNKPNGWNEWSRFVLRALEDGKGERRDICIEVKELRIAFEAFRAQMIVRAGIWGAVAGIIPAIGILLIVFLRGR